MTATTESGAGTALAHVPSGVLASVEPGKQWTVTDLVEALAAPAPVLPPAQAFPRPAKPVTMNPVVETALKGLPDVYGTVNVSDRRELDTDELKTVTVEYQAIQAVLNPLGERKKTISEMIRAHQDVQAEKAGLAIPAAVTRGGKLVTPASQRVAEGVAKGHYLLADQKKPFETPVEGWDMAWQQRLVAGKAFSSLSRLEDLADDGEITRREYLAFTRAERVLDQERIADQIRKNPARALQILAAITERAQVTASLYAPTR
jgi:hypothetical protein